MNTEIQFRINSNKIDLHREMFFRQRHGRLVKLNGLLENEMFMREMPET